MPAGSALPGVFVFAIIFVMRYDPADSTSPR
jgi:hypothetical protein